MNQNHQGRTPPIEYFHIQGVGHFYQSLQLLQSGYRLLFHRRILDAVVGVGCHRQISGGRA
ncbi:hypothetical protein [Pseudomonas lopnurensis]|uniref:hypothetical protein n=1 Tax=Pseudomonas lopnurensis TaxID=1477517 RepID=UPI001F206ED1|nr:hypothetical protein [Pseudomonas lopnurensis]